LSGTTVVIGAQLHNGRQGAAYVFVQSGATWTLQQELTASDGAGDDYFGESIALSGTTVVISGGHLVDNNPTNQSVAYVFVQSNGTWVQRQELTSSDEVAGDEFTTSIALSGATAVISAPGHEVGGNSNQGAAYVFVESNGTWSQQQELIASDGGALDFFGNSVALSGTTALIGASNKNSSRGAAYTFVQSGTVWSQQQKLTGSLGYIGQDFGFSVALSGTTAVIGAPDGGTAGETYIFTESDGIWSQQQELTPSDGVLGDNFGVSVALSGATAVIGASGKRNGIGWAYVFAGLPSPATLTTPTPGSKLTSTSVEFTWPAVSGASAYDLHLSAVAPGGYDLYTSDHITGTSTTANDLPINGGTIYARLYTIVDGYTQYNDSTYTAMTATLAQMIYPAPGSTITTSKVWFDWTPGTGVTQYDLHLSAVAPGGYDLDASGPITRTYKTVFSIPLNGETIYARLYSIIDGELQYIDYTYKAQ